jgi:tetratricopeptide (TPR) repeat protein
VKPLAAAGLAAVVLVATPVVHAQQALPTKEAEAAARQHHDRGSKLYDQGRYLEAAREFEAGYEADARPLFLLNIGHSYRRAQDLRRAKAAYEKLLRTDPTTPQRPMVEDLIKTIDDALTVQELAVPPTRVPPPLPPVSSAAVAPAPARAPDLIATPPPAPPAPPPPTWLRNPWVWGVVAGVVTAGVAGTVFALTRGPSCPANACWKEP